MWFTDLQETMQAEKEAYDALQEQKKQSRTALLKSKKQVRPDASRLLML